jgi:hypothetical protein
MASASFTMPVFGGAATSAGAEEMTADDTRRL